jgi:hypothetical protein
MISIPLLTSKLSSLGLIIVGFFPAHKKIPHLIGAALLLIGFFITSNLLFLINFLEHRKLRKTYNSHKNFLTVYRILIVAFTTVTIMFIISLLLEVKIFTFPGNPPKLLSCPLWEWIYFISSCLTLSVGFGDKYFSSPNEQGLSNRCGEKYSRDAVRFY